MYLKRKRVYFVSSSFAKSSIRHPICCSSHRPFSHLLESLAHNLLQTTRMSADGGAAVAAGELPEALRAGIEENMRGKEVDLNHYIEDGYQ